MISGTLVGMTSTPIVIVAHPLRARMAHRLYEQLQQGTTGVSNTTICWDNQNKGAEKNHLRAWRWLAESYGTGWGAVLEDDVILCPGFRHQLADALAIAPTPIVSLYLGRGRPPHRQQDIAKVITTDASWIVGPELLSAQGYAMRIEYFTEWKSLMRYTGRWPIPIDEAITHWITSRKTQLTRMYRPSVGYTVPSLVDHRDGPSLVTHWDEDTRDGKTALMAEDCDPSGADLPEVRKAWRFGPHKKWTSSIIELESHFTKKESE